MHRTGTALPHVTRFSLSCPFDLTKLNVGCRRKSGRSLTSGSSLARKYQTFERSAFHKACQAPYAFASQGDGRIRPCRYRRVPKGGCFSSRFRGQFSKNTCCIMSMCLHQRYSRHTDSSVLAYVCMSRHARGSDSLAMPSVRLLG